MVAIAPVASFGQQQTQPQTVAMLDVQQAQPVVEVKFDPNSKMPVPGLKAMLQRSDAKMSEALAGYRAIGFRSVWLASDGKAAQALISIMSGAPYHALPDQSNRVLLLSRILDRALDGRNPAAAELAFTQAFVDFMPMVADGVVEPSEVDEEIFVHPDSFPISSMLRMIGQVDDPGEMLNSFMPQDPAYEVLRQRYNTLRWQLSHSDAPFTRILKGPLIRPGTTDLRIPDIRQRLYDLQESVSKPETYSAYYDQDLKSAVIAFQERHGLNADGLIGDVTLDYLNVSLEQRVLQMAVNLERMRWLEKPQTGKFIWVNQPDFRMWVMNGAEKIFTSRVVIGQAEEHRTPEFSDRMTFLEANPTWTVPYDIAVEELLPILQSNPNYLDENNMHLLGGTRPPPEDYSTINWNDFNEKNFPYYIRQAPGPGNALGQVKFMFPNEHDIYLHDTPHKGLFSRDNRAFSHGCIRVQEPMELAHLLLSDQMEDSVKGFTEILDTKEKTQILLKRVLPVHLTYRTAWIGDGGAMNFRNDIYGRDAKVIEAMRAKGVRM